MIMKGKRNVTWKRKFEIFNITACSPYALSEKEKVNLTFSMKKKVDITTCRVPATEVLLPETFLAAKTFTETINFLSLDPSALLVHKF